MSNYHRHVRGHSDEKKFNCTKCDKAFKRKEHQVRHEKNCKRELPQASGSGIQPKKRKIHTGEFTIRKAKTAFANATITWKLKYPKNDGSVELLKSSVNAMESKLEQYREDERALKFSMSLHVNFEQAVDSSIITNPPVVLLSEQFEVYADSDIDEILKVTFNQLTNRIETYEGIGSGWIVSNFVALDTTVWKLDPLRASSYHDLPAWVKNTKCVVNVKNTDQKCFKYAVQACLYEPSSPTHASRVSSYTYTEKLEDAPDFSMLKYPVALRHIDQFEKKNDISINVYGIEGKFDFQLICKLSFASHTRDFTHFL